MDINYVVALVVLKLKTFNIKKSTVIPVFNSQTQNVTYVDSLPIQCKDEQINEIVQQLDTLNAGETILANPTQIKRQNILTPSSAPTSSRA